MMLEIPENLVDEVIEALEERAEGLRELEHTSDGDRVSEAVWKNLADGLWALVGALKSPEASRMAGNEGETK